MSTYLNKKLVLHLNITLPHPPDFYVLNREEKIHMEFFIHCTNRAVQKLKTHYQNMQEFLLLLY